MLPFSGLSDESFEQFISLDAVPLTDHEHIPNNSTGDLLDDLPTNKDALLIAHINLISMGGFKLLDVKHWLYSRKIDILIVAETNS